MRISVVICTHEPDPVRLTRVVAAITPQLEQIDRAELLVVDNHSTPPLAERGVLDSFPLTLVSQPVPGLTAAREAGIAAARGDILVFVDDDNEIGPGYLTTVAEIFKRYPRVGVLGGSVFPEYEHAPPKIGDMEACLAVRPRPADTWIETVRPPYSEAFPIGAGLAVRRELARSYIVDSVSSGRIEGHRGTQLTSGEDVDLDLFALSRGYTLAVSGKLRITHIIPSARLDPEYLERLVLGGIDGALSLERKWAGKLSTPVYPMFATSLLLLAAKALASACLSPVSLKYRLKCKSYRRLIAIRRA